MMFGFLTFILVLFILFSLHLLGLILSLRSVQIFKTIEIQGYKIHYRSSGSGSKKVIMLHGMFSNLHCWDKFLAVAHPGYEYITLDLPQMAESYTPKKVTPADNIEDIIYEFCMALKLESPALVGCSLGGLVSYLATLKYSDYFSECIIVASPFDSRLLLLPVYKLSFLAPLLNLFVNPIIVGIAYLRITGANFSIEHVLIIFSKFRRTMHFKSSMIYLSLIPRSEKATIIQTKVEKFHFIWGTKDHLIKKSSFKKFLDSNRTLDYLEMPNASHHPMESHPQLFADTLQEMLTRSSK
jgi:pimeloyl-ACP methyl ester carboxylesterase